jgi:glutathione S-transferase
VATLYSLGYSPWSEKARWALDHHHIEYSEREHIPLMGEPLLRWRARRVGAARTSVPLFVDGELAIADSFEILRHADRVGRGSQLICNPECEQLNEWADEALRHARARVVLTTLERPAALDEASEAVAPTFVTPVLRPVARHIARYLARKHGAELTSVEALNAQMAAVLDRFDARLAGKLYFFDEFSAADICLAMVLQAVEPVAGGHVRLGRATKSCWQAPELARAYAHLLAWRDAVYAKHR